MLGKVPCVNGLMQSYHVLLGKPCHGMWPTTLAELLNHPMWYRATGVGLRYMILLYGLVVSKN